MRLKPKSLKKIMLLKNERGDNNSTKSGGL
jgi:hypothetical protein